MRLTTTLLFLAVTQLTPARQTTREIAVTFDDLPVASVVDDGGKSWATTTDTLLSALLRNNVPAVGFVNEQRLERNGAVDSTRVELLRGWAKSFALGNHTYSHLDFHSADVEVFERDIVRGETVTRSVLQAAGQPLRFFRHPFLHTGRSLEARRELETFLSGRGYRVAPVTIDNYDYVFSAAYERARNEAVRDEVVNEYVRYITDVVTFYEQQSTVILGREIRQILLLHVNALNALVFDDIANMLRGRGYSFVSLDRALEDPAFALPDTYVGAGGITWLHRWALTQGKGGAIFAGEPRVPDWVERASRPPTRGSYPLKFFGPDVRVNSTVATTGPGKGATGHESRFTRYQG